MCVCVHREGKAHRLHVYPSILWVDSNVLRAQSFPHILRIPSITPSNPSPLSHSILCHICIHTLLPHTMASIFLGNLKWCYSVLLLLLLFFAASYEIHLLVSSFKRRRYLPCCTVPRIFGAQVVSSNNRHWFTASIFFERNEFSAVNRLNVNKHNGSLSTQRPIYVRAFFLALLLSCNSMVN